MCLKMIAKIQTKSKLFSFIQHAVAGYVSEELFLDEASTGASGDIRQVTEVAKEMIMSYGMGDKTGFINMENLEDAQYLGYRYGGEKDYSEATAQLVDEEIKKLVDKGMAGAKKILTEKKKYVEKLVKLLIEKEVV